MASTRLPIEERYDVEQYLDGCWYVVSTEFPFTEGICEKLLDGPFKTEQGAWFAYFDWIDAYYVLD